MKSNQRISLVSQQSGLTPLSLEDIKEINAGSEISDYFWEGLGIVAKGIYNFFKATNDAQKAGPIRPSEYR
ncbi:MAG TPA: hypothetical protein PK110_14925 [Niabella sp.]|jgi:hypothetical protein|nr:hypothetical protein [Chitinophagaceae bacterium]HRN71201.1 hypothetical protein [Candidatus Woesebacteria bacterium]HRO86115.1 hypothetical protein [Niabella sp.]